jgi:hypothetical protein
MARRKASKRKQQRKSRSKHCQLGGKSKATVRTVKGGGLVGRLGPDYPDYTPVAFPFQMRYANPLVHLPHGSHGIQNKKRRATSSKKHLPHSSGSLEVTISGKPVTLFPKGQRVTTTTR